MCIDCDEHHQVNGPRCLYCHGMNPPRRSYHRLLVCLWSFVCNPLSFLLHRIPDLVR